MKLSKFLVLPGCLMALKYFHIHFNNNSESYFGNFTNFFTVSAAKKCKSKTPTYYPSFPLPENAEYAGELGCHKVIKRRKRLYVAHMYRGTTKKVLDAHRKHLRAYKIDPKAEFVYFPPATYLNYVKKTYPKNVMLGIQNIYPKEFGNYTGEVSLSIAKDVGVEYVMVGTQHRRSFFGETNKFINAKVRHVLNNKMKCLIFVSNTLGRYDECSHDMSIKNQLESLIPAINLEEWDNVSLAYEAAGQSFSSTAEMVKDAQRSCKMIRKSIESQLGSEISDRVKILYSGEVDHSSAPDFMAEEDIDGLVFSPRHDNECFINIINSGILADQRREKRETELEGDKKDSCIIVREEILS